MHWTLFVLEFDIETIGEDIDSLRRKVSQLEQAYSRLNEKEVMERRLHGVRECFPAQLWVSG